MYERPYAVYRGTKRDSTKHFAIKPLSLAGKVKRDELDEFNTVVKLLGRSRTNENSLLFFEPNLFIPF